MRSKLIRTIENALKKYTNKPIRIVDLQQEYDLAIFYEEEDMNHIYSLETNIDNNAYYFLFSNYFKN